MSSIISTSHLGGGGAAFEASRARYASISNFYRYPIDDSLCS